MGAPQKDDIANAIHIVNVHAKVLMAQHENVMTQEIMKTAAPEGKKNATFGFPSLGILDA